MTFFGRLECVIPFFSHYNKHGACVAHQAFLREKVVRDRRCEGNCKAAKRTEIPVIYIARFPTFLRPVCLASYSMYICTVLFFVGQALLHGPICVVARNALFHKKCACWSFSACFFLLAVDTVIHMVIRYSRVRIYRVRLPIVLVIS